MKLNIVMVEPEIPQNTGNIARTCAIIGAKLHFNNFMFNSYFYTIYVKIIIKYSWNNKIIAKKLA